MEIKHKIYVGYDSREDIAWQVCRHSLVRHASKPISVHPLRQPALRELGLYVRHHDSFSSTEFSLTRFLTPYIAAHEGWTLFVDCDFLFTQDVVALMDSLDPGKSVYVVKHDYTPAHAIKMDGKLQTSYPRKNWSSLIFFNGASPSVKALTPDVVSEASPSFLHRLEWLKDDEIGELDLRWNFLVGEYPQPEQVPAAIHFTNGGPWFSSWSDVAYADLWLEEEARYLEESEAGQIPALA